MKKTLLLFLLSGAPVFAQTLEFSKLETRMIRANWNTLSIPVGQASFAARITEALADTTAKLDKNQVIAVANAFEDKGWFAGADSFVVAYREYRDSVKFKTKTRQKFIEQFFPNYNDQLALSNAWAKIRKFLVESAK